MHLKADRKNDNATPCPHRSSRRFHIRRSTRGLAPIRLQKHLQFHPEEAASWFRDRIWRGLPCHFSALAGERSGQTGLSWARRHESPLHRRRRELKASAEGDSILGGRSRSRHAWAGSRCPSPGTKCLRRGRLLEKGAPSKGAQQRPGLRPSWFRARRGKLTGLNAR